MSIACTWPIRRRRLYHKAVGRRWIQCFPLRNPPLLLVHPSSHRQALLVSLMKVIALVLACCFCLYCLSIILSIIYYCLSILVLLPAAPFGSNPAPKPQHVNDDKPVNSPRLNRDVQTNSPRFNRDLHRDRSPSGSSDGQPWVRFPIACNN